MPKKVLPRIRAVVPTAAPFTLHIDWTNGTQSEVNLSSLIASYRVFSPLRSRPDLFATARVGDEGTDVVWTDEMDVANDTLWRLAQEQSGATMSAAAFQAWRKRRHFTLDAAAENLGLSRRMVAYYENGRKPIPRVVALATKALESEAAG